MRIGYLECFAGISGDMLLGALIDAGIPADLLEQTARSLNIGAELRLERVDRSGIRSAKAHVEVDGQPAESAGHHHHHDHAHSHGHHHHGDEHSHDHGHEHAHSHGRSWKQIRELISHTALPEEAQALALRAFELLAQAEGKIHGVPPEDVHFHEVGNVDTITDIVCCAVGLSSLNVERWYASAVNVGAGHVHCAHGQFPVPAPATAELLKGVPTYSTGPKRELTTPTGAALLRALECSFGKAPVIAARAIGYGAGTANPEGFPNVLRLTIGESVESGRPGAEAGKSDRVTVLECAVDDANPQVVAHAMELALENGALDTMAVPVTMKKGRLGTLLTVLTKPENAAVIEELLFRETTTLGIRRRTEERVILDRSLVTVETNYGRIRVKVGSSGGERRNAMPEYEDCRRAAREHGVPLKQVMEAALVAFAESTVKA
ncbi:MAG: nickel pincer cofactor biosynthesis protein LarC [Silvibacterium sp.]|nr:nickel pincer cofactor biosynthesis protein LarC [Silvibacterium sp.]